MKPVSAFICLCVHLSRVTYFYSNVSVSICVCVHLISVFVYVCFHLCLYLPVFFDHIVCIYMCLWSWCLHLPVSVFLMCAYLWLYLPKFVFICDRTYHVSVHLCRYLLVSVFTCVYTNLWLLYWYLSSYMTVSTVFIMTVYQCLCSPKTVFTCLHSSLTIFITVCVHLHYLPV